jgi:uncharacterized protein (DUF4415 family)
MNENKRAIATDLKRLDAHVVQSNEYKDAPELTDEQLARADLHQGGKLIRRGRPLSPTRKKAIKLRIDPDVLAIFRASGPGWQTRINDALRMAAAVVARTGSPLSFRTDNRTFVVRPATAPARKPARIVARKPATASKATAKKTAAGTSAPAKKATKRTTGKRRQVLKRRA